MQKSLFNTMCTADIMRGTNSYCVRMQLQKPNEKICSNVCGIVFPFAPWKHRDGVSNCQFVVIIFLSIKAFSNCGAIAREEVLDFWLGDSSGVRVVPDWCQTGFRAVSDWCQTGVRLVSDWS